MAQMKTIPLIAELEKQIKPLRVKIEQLSNAAEELKERHFALQLDLEELQRQAAKGKL